MSTLLKFSEAAALAIHAMVYLAAHGEEPEPVTAHQLAGACKASEATLMKVCQRLAKSGYIQARRGPQGGFRLIRDPQEISLLDIYVLIEGPLSLNHCLFQKRACQESDKLLCVFGSKIREVEEDFVAYLQSTSLLSIAGRCRLKKED